LPRAAKKSLEILVFSLELLSVPLIFSTFLKPLKDEYREGLVAFSVFMGIVVKSLIILADLLILLFLGVTLLLIILIIAALPILLIILAI
jgi:hypothetical protein